MTASVDEEEDGGHVGSDAFGQLFRPPGILGFLTIVLVPGLDMVLQHRIGVEILAKL